MSGAPAAAWWDDRPALTRFVCDLVAGEFAAIRPGYALPAGPWPAAMRLDEAGLGADSLDRLKLATALGEAIHLGRSGIDDALLTQLTIGDWVETAARSLARYSAELTFATSGSTGAPKWCVHTLADLDEEINVLAAKFAGCRRVVSTVPSHHIYGFLFTLLLPARLAVEVFDGRARSPGAFASGLRGGDLVVGHPAFWSAFVRGAPRVDAGIRAVTSTAPCPLDVARAVVATGIDSLVEVYGSSETAGIGLRDDPEGVYELFPYWHRGAKSGELVRDLPAGGERVVAVPDRLVWDDPRRFRPAGRHEGVVQVGGQNVFLDRVRSVLCEHPAVADATVRLMRPDEGDRLKAFVVARDSAADQTQLRADLWAWIEARLTVPERPRAFAFGPVLPTNALGKDIDWPISDGGEVRS